MEIRCAIVDDNRRDLQKISDTVTQLSFEARCRFIISAFLTGEDRLFSENYDLYIFDIDLPEQNGFQLASRLFTENKNATVVFCTNHDEFVFDSFKLNAFYFVRKSFLDTDLPLAIRKFLRTIDSKNTQYIVHSGDRIRSINYSDILYFEVSRNTLYVHTDKTEYPERKTLKKLIAELPRYRFLQINHSFVVNAEHIIEIIDNNVVLSNGQHFNISRRMIKQVKEEFAFFLSRRI